MESYKDLLQFGFPKFGKDFLRTWDKTDEQIIATLLLAEILHDSYKVGYFHELYKSGLAISWFRDQSTRTRYSFKSAANYLGLDVVDLDEKKTQIAHGETIKETVNMISYLTKFIGIRDDIFLGEGHKFQKEVANSLDFGFKKNLLAFRPGVINLQSDEDHPTQSLTDVLHLKRYFGNLEALKGKRIVMSWAYSPSYGKPLSVAQGFVSLATRFGADVVLAYPRGYNLIPKLEKNCKENARKSGGKFTIINNMADAFRGADVVYPKSWAAYETMKLRTKYLRVNDTDALEILEKDSLNKSKKYIDWECNEKMMALTKNKKAFYMHCLPADISGLNTQKGEVSAAIFDKFIPQTYTQASYKPFVIMAMMILIELQDAKGVSAFLRRSREQLVNL